MANYQQANLIKIERLLKSRKPILLNNAFIKKVLGYDDMRDFTKDLGDWGYVTDFTYLDYQTQNWQSHLRRFLKETFLD